MDRCVLLTSTPSWVVSPRGDHSGCALVIARRGETTHSGVDVNNTHLSMINPLSTVYTIGVVPVSIAYTNLEMIIVYDCVLVTIIGELPHLGIKIFFFSLEAFCSIYVLYSNVSTHFAVND